MRLILPIAMLAGLVVMAALPAPGEPEREAASGLTIAIGSGGIRASGQIPRGIRPKTLRDAVPGIEFADTFARDGDGDPAAWRRAIDALTVVLPRLAAGEARIIGRRIAIRGRLKPGFSAEATRSSVRLMLGAGWELAISVEEAPPRAALRVAKTGAALSVDGILPAGLGAREALVYLGPAAAETRGELLTGGGRGDADAWRRALDALGTVTPLFAELEAEVGRRRLTLDGTLLPGYDGATLGDWLSGRLAEGWTAELTARTTEAREGDLRRYPFAAQPERLVQGHWLPVFHFRPGPAACAGHSRQALDGGAIGFTWGGSEIDAVAAPVLDRLAGIARRCVREGGLHLVIGGHTDNSGDAARNLALSRLRAEAVREALAQRGVPGDAMEATGFGESDPIAPNDSPADRARNRRITFDWSR